MTQLLISDKERWVDRRGATRTVPMRVLVLGYPRTGTSSMRAALEMLGYGDVHHMMAVFGNPPEAEMWTEAINARFFGRGTPYGRAEWDQLLGHCQAVTDTPAAMFAADLVAAYPEAKVILTNRDPDKWWKSFSESIGAIIGSWMFRLAALLDPQGLGRAAAVGQLVVSVIIGPIMTEEGGKARFVEHYDNVRKIVPKDRLLEYEVRQGWGPLCAFLGNDVPDVPFPRTNDTQMMHERQKNYLSGNTVVCDRIGWFSSSQLSDLSDVTLKPLHAPGGETRV
ncbi:P-loop containing nucleoside triphosphate hydrolase protein [Mycena capillaripes]|nr:P-loop containing nucleoside triphosphate hydrolase protein [Mycena capillaripes]